MGREVPPPAWRTERMEMGGKTRLTSEGNSGMGARQEVPCPEIHLAAESRNFA